MLRWPSGMARPALLVLVGLVHESGCAARSPRRIRQDTSDSRNRAAKTHPVRQPSLPVHSHSPRDIDPLSAPAALSGAERTTPSSSHVRARRIRSTTGRLPRAFSDRETRNSQTDARDNPRPATVKPVGFEFQRCSRNPHLFYKFTFSRASAKAVQSLPFAVPSTLLGTCSDRSHRSFSWLNIYLSRGHTQAYESRRRHRPQPTTDRPHSCPSIFSGCQKLTGTCKTVQPLASLGLTHIEHSSSDFRNLLIV